MTNQNVTLYRLWREAIELCKCLENMPFDKVKEIYWTARRREIRRKKKYFVDIETRHNRTL